jgi:glycosyltransferase involved in cell wall biosynthesis
MIFSVHRNAVRTKHVPKVSVIITTHNRPRLLPRAVESARAAAADVEIIVVDDASTDETAEVCRRLDGTRYLRVDRNQGVAGARNLGLLASTGEYVSFLDDDDVRLQGSLDEQAEILESSPDAGLVYGQALLGDRSCTPTGSFYPERCPRGDLFWELLESNFIPCGSVLFRKSCVYRVGLLDRNIAGIDDWDFWIRIAELYPLAVLERPVIVWRQSTTDSGQGSSKTVALISLSLRLLRKRWLFLPRARSAGPKRRRRAWRGFSDNLSEHIIWETAASLVRVEPGRVLKGLKVALRLHPLSPLRAAWRWARLSTLSILASEVFAHNGLSEAKARLKRARSQGSDHGSVVR